MRCRIWRDRSNAYICAFCRQNSLVPRDAHRSYSSASNPSPLNSSQPGSWSNGSAHNWESARGPIANGSWGAPAFAPKSAIAGDYASNGATPNRLLPHELAARERLDHKPAQPVTPILHRPTPRNTERPVPDRLARGLSPFTSERDNRLGGLGSSPKMGLGSSLSGPGGRFKRGLDDTVGLRATRPEPSARFQGRSDPPPPSSSNEWGLLRKKTATVGDKNRSSQGGLGAKWPPEGTVDPFEAAFANVIDTSAKAGGDSGKGKKSTRKSGFRSQGGLDERASGPTGSDPFANMFTSRINDSAEQKDSGGEDFWSQLQSRVSKPPRGPPEPQSTRIVNMPPENEPQAERRLAFSESYEISRDPRRKSDRIHGGEVPARKSKKSASRRGTNNIDDDRWDAVAEQRDEERRLRKAERKAAKGQVEAFAAPPTIFIPEFISISNLAIAMKMKPADFRRSIEEMGFEDITEDSIMTGETAAIVAVEFGFDPTVDTGGTRDLKPRAAPEDMSTLPPRPPVVTIMGHVDHGKTTLLDWLRKSSVAAQEHGGITQHIGAFMVKMSSGKPITFLDTPGHAAFLTMRQRGANITDIVVLVVAADDSVKPQTLEALKHARAAKVPIIVAINKIDKEDARPDQVKADLARHGVEIEDFGGDVQVVAVSGKTGKGMDELEENIVLLSEVLDMRAETDGMSEGWVLESSIKQVGKSATVLVKRGTLRPGDCIVAGTTWARIRTLRSEAGVDLEEAPPGTPVEIVGWRELPAAGDQVLQAPDEDRARTAVEYREEMRDREESSRQLVEQEQRERERRAAAEAEAAGEEQTTESSVKTVHFIVKGDVHGSVEAVCATILEIGNNEVRPRILQSSAGQVSESDVEYAATSDSVIVNFNSPIPGPIKGMADDKGVKVIDHTVIYHLADDVKAAMSAYLADVVSTKVLGEADVAQVFPINVKGRMFKNVAGCKVRNGLVSRNARVRILRKGKQIFDGKIDTLKQVKKDVAEIRKGTECGISFDGFQGFEPGDQIQTYEEVREKRKL